MSWIKILLQKEGKLMNDLKLDPGKMALFMHCHVGAGCVGHLQVDLVSLGYVLWDITWVMFQSGHFYWSTL